MASARSQRAAAVLNAQMLLNNQAATTTQLEGYNDKGIAALGQGVAGARTDLNAGLDKTLGALGSAYGTGTAAINQGYGQGRTDYQTGIDTLNPYVARGNTAGDMYSNSLGLGGAAGNQAATNAFQAGPGYQWQVDQSVDAAARKANALGISASGNTLDALGRLGSNLANQEYGGWQDRLSGLNTAGQAAATTQAGMYGQMGNLAAQGGSAQASLAQNYGQNQASAYNDVGKTLAGANMTQGTGTAGLYSGLGNSIANLNMATTNGITQNNMAASAASDAARNANANLPLQIAGMGLQALGGGGGGSIFSNVGKLFG